MRIAAGEVPPTARHSPARLFTSAIGVSGAALAEPARVLGSRPSASVMASITDLIGFLPVPRRCTRGARPARSCSTKPAYAANRVNETGAPQDAVADRDRLEAAQAVTVHPAEGPDSRELEHVDGGAERPVHEGGRRGVVQGPLRHEREHAEAEGHEQVRRR